MGSTDLSVTVQTRSRVSGARSSAQIDREGSFVKPRCGFVSHRFAAMEERVLRKLMGSGVSVLRATLGRGVREKTTVP